MSSNSQSQRILSFVRLLTMTGMIVFITTLAVVGVVLHHVRGERAYLTAEQGRLNEASDQLRHFAAQSRAEMQATLDSMEAAPDVRTAAINLQRFVQSEIHSSPDPAVMQPLVELDVEVSRLLQFQKQADNWRMRYEVVWSDLSDQISLKKLRDGVTQLRAAVAATQTNRSRDDDPLNDQLAELARLAEVLSGEEHIDSLLDLKDHQINPLFDKVSHLLDERNSSASAGAPITSKSLDAVRAAFFGVGAVNGKTGTDAAATQGGLYNLRRDELLLNEERQALKTQSSSLFEDIELANANFARSAQIRTMTLAQEMETTLRSGWIKMLLLGGGCSAVFLWLAFMIARGISGQVNVIEQARAEAETGRQTTHKLMLEQQAAAAELKIVHKKLLEASRQAGMAEVATGVLHNVGNVLNSVNVSSSVISEKLKKSRLGHLQKIVGLIRSRESDLAAFITSDPAGKQIPGFLSQLSEFLGAEQSACLSEMSELQKNIDHIKEIVGTQQAYAGTAGFIEQVDLRELMEDGLRIHRAALLRHDVNVVSEFAPTPHVYADKHKILQILVNLISNAKHAMKDSTAKTLTLRIESDADNVRVSVRDTGYGIAPENLTRIFAHGFTTKKDGHGYGLHSGALAAIELGGFFRVHSDGPGHGAVFTLELPMGAARATAA